MGILVFIIFLAVVSNAACAEGIYLDAGVGAHSNYYDNKSTGDSTVYMANPIGIIEAGYCGNNWCGFYYHASSIPDRHDDGLNMIGIKIRLIGKN